MGEHVQANVIAERLGVTRTAVSNWAGGLRFGGTFPKPVGMKGRRPVWDWDEVLAWRETVPVNKGGAPKGNRNNPAHDSAGKFTKKAS